MENLKNKEFLSKFGIFSVYVHVVGFACIGGGVFMGLWAFFDINFDGYFLAHEPNPLLRTTEFSAMLYAAVYLTYLMIKFTRGFGRR